MKRYTAIIILKEKWATEYKGVSGLEESITIIIYNNNNKPMFVLTVYELEEV